VVPEENQASPGNNNLALQDLEKPVCSIRKRECPMTLLGKVQKFRIWEIVAKEYGLE